MRESGYFPAGAEFDPSAPYNQEEQPEKEFDVVCSQTLSKNDSVFTNGYDYIEDYDPEDGGYVSYDTINVIWSEEWHDNDHYTPLQLIELFQKYLLDEVNGSCTVNKNTNYLNHLISECEGWTEDETDYVEE